MEDHLDDFTEVIAAETGRSPAESRGEAQGAIALGRFFAGEGRRLYGRTVPSALATKQVSTVREPVGVAALIVASNAPIANVAWKAFPALVCGNAVVLKAAEDTPAAAWLFGELARRAGVPDGVLNIVHGLGDAVGRPLVADERVDVVSFTGSTAVGREIAQVAAGRLARVSLELGGKNPFVVCDDADLDKAVRWAALSAFSNAGSALLVGQPHHRHRRHLRRVRGGAACAHRRAAARTGRRRRPRPGRLRARTAADHRPARRGRRHQCTDPRRRRQARHARARGRHLPRADRRGDPRSRRRAVARGAVRPGRPALPGTRLRGGAGDGQRLALRADRRDPHPRLRPCDALRREVSAGVAVVNGGTFGSEPHMPFGGRRASGNGTREPGTEALDVYSELKAVYLWADHG
jgi:alpha-ketoglutaric semialdehyde dehydrogenase